MKKKIMFGLVRTKILLLIILEFCFSAMAGDWYELNTMDESELAEKIGEFRKRLGQNPEDWETLKGLGIAYHIMATKNAREYAPLAFKTLSKVHGMNETDCVSLCYLGSATTMMAATTNDLMEKSSYTNRGIALMDKAVRKAPDNVNVRLTRAYNSKSLPDFLERKSVAVEDFEHLAGMIRKGSLSSISIKKAVYSNLAELYEKIGHREKAEAYHKLANGL